MKKKKHFDRVWPLKVYFDLNRNLSGAGEGDRKAALFFEDIAVLGNSVNLCRCVKPLLRMMSTKTCFPRETFSSSQRRAACMTSLQTQLRQIVGLMFHAAEK